MDMETVRVVKNNRAGYATIYKADFNPDKHVLFGAEPVQETEQAVDMTKAELTEWLNERSIYFRPNASKAELLALYKGGE